MKENFREDGVYACDNKVCAVKSECKRFKMFELGETVVATNEGTKKGGCDKHLPLVNKG